MKKILSLALLLAAPFAARADYLIMNCHSNKTVQAGISWTFDPPNVSSCCSCGSEFGTTNYTLSVLSSVSNNIGCAETYTRTWGASNPCGGTNYCSQTVTVYAAPYIYIYCASNKTVSCTSPWSFDVPSVVSQCDCGSNYTMTFSTLTNGTCPEVVTRIWWVTNPCSQSNTCEQVVTVVNPNQPVFQGATNITVFSCTNVQVAYNVTASEACCGALNVTCSPPSGSYFPPGTTTVLYQTTDCCGLVSSNVFMVSVEHTNTPVFQGVNPITVWACGGTNVYFNPTATETCCGPLNVACSPRSGSFFGPGLSTVSCLVTDCFGQASTTNFTVLVMGSTNPPVFDPTSVRNLTYPACASGPISFGTPSASSGCCSNVSVVCTPASGVVLGPGMSTNIQCVATDCLGHTARTNFLLSVVAPTLQLSCHNKTVNCGDTNWSFDVPDIQLGCCPNTNYTLVGLTPVTNGNCPVSITKAWQITDPCGHSNTCAQTVTVVPLPPVINCPADIVTACGATNQVPVYFSVTAASPCGGPVTVVCQPPSGSLFPAGTNVVTCYAVDACSNQSAPCSFQVVVPQGSSAVVLSCGSILYGLSQSNGFSTLETISTSGVTTPQFGVGTGFVALAYAAPDLGYGSDLFYAIANDNSGFSTLYTISTSGAVLPRFGVGTGFSSLAFAAPDLGYGPDLLYGIAADNTGFCTFYTISTSGTVVARFGLGFGFSSLTFAAPDLGLGGPDLFYTIARNTSLYTVSTGGSINPSFGLGSGLGAGFYGVAFAADDLGYRADLLYTVSQDQNGFSELYTVSAFTGELPRFGLGGGFGPLAYRPSAAPMTSCPRTVLAGTPLNFNPPGVLDSCCADTNYTFAAYPLATNGVCPQLISQTWLVSDNCGNSNLYTETVTIVVSAPLQFTSIVPSSPPGSAILSGTGTACTQYTIQTSSDLRSWTDTGTVTTDSSGGFSFTVDTTAFPYLFYRLHSP